MTVSSQGFKIWAHHALDTADAGVMQQFSRCRALTLAAKLESFYCNIQANLVTEFEAVSDGLFRPINSDLHPINFVLFNALSERIAGKPEDAQWRIIESRPFHRS